MGKRTLSVKNLMKLLWKMEDALFISVRGENAEEVPKELVIFLKICKGRPERKSGRFPRYLC